MNNPIKSFLPCLLLPFLCGLLPASSLVEHLPYGTPLVQCNCTLVIREGYILLHDNDKQIARWVAYRLDADDLMYTGPRPNDFREDPLIQGKRAELDDYAGSGYDRGHMAPAADQRKTAKMLSESFFLSNMAPQHSRLNRREWARLEAQIRTWRESRESLWIYTGPAFDIHIPRKTIGDGVFIPTHFWKIIVDKQSGGRLTAIAFLMPNRGTASFRYYRVTIDAIELATGIDFFGALPDNQENTLESLVREEEWP